MNLEKAVINYCIDTPEFTLKKIEEELGTSSKGKQNNIADYLEFCALTFHSITNRKSDKLFSRHCFFKGTKFRIVLSDYEIKNSILIPGHRFVPFYYSDLFQTSFTVIDAKTQSNLLKKKISAPVSDLYQYYYMFGSDPITDSLTAEDKGNFKVVGKNTKGIVKINVFDLKEIKLSSKVKNFDSMVIEVLDWTNGIFSAELRNDISPAQTEEAYIFAEEIQSALYKVFEKFGTYLEAPEQLAWAYFLADKKKIKEPVISLEEAVSLSESIDLKYSENETILWFKSDDGSSWNEHHSHKSKDILSVSAGNTSSIDAIFDELGIPFTSKEVVLFLNAFRQNHSDYMDFLAEVFPGNISFKDKAQEIVFHNLIDEFFESVNDTGLPLHDTKQFEIIRDGINRLKKLSKNYSPELLTVKRSHEEASLIYRDIKDHINSLSSVLSFYHGNPHSLLEIERISDLSDYIDSLFSNIENLLGK